jgi:hypothetical protein
VDSAVPQIWYGKVQAELTPILITTREEKEVKNIPVNYAIRSSGPVTALTACRVRYGVGPDLICQPGPSPGIKTHSSPAAFPTTLSLPFVPFPPLSPACTAPLMPQAAPGPTYSPARPLVPTEPIRRGQWEKCRSATADSHSLDASAALSRRPSDPCVDP